MASYLAGNNFVAWRGVHHPTHQREAACARHSGVEWVQPRGIFHKHFLERSGYEPAQRLLCQAYARSSVSAAVFIVKFTLILKTLRLAQHIWLGNVIDNLEP